MSGDDAPRGVSSARDMVRGLLGLGIALLFLVCSGGLERDGPRLIQAVGVLVGAVAVYLVTRAPRGPVAGRTRDERQRLRWLVRGLGLVFLVAEVLHFEAGWLEAFDLLFEAPFVIALGALVFAHVRAGDPLVARLRVDVALVGVVLASMWMLRVVKEAPGVADTRMGKALYGIATLAAVVAGLVLWRRGPQTIRRLSPPPLSAVWRERARADRWAVHEDHLAAFVADVPVGAHLATIRVERDPVPPCTSLRVVLPELEGVTIRARSDGDADIGVSTGDDVLDAALEIHGPTGRLSLALDAERPTWMRLLHSAGGVVDDGVLQLVFDGSTPRPSWVRDRRALAPDEVVDLVISDLQRLSRSLTTP